VNRLTRIFHKFDPFSLQFRLTIGIAAFSTLGFASLATWTSWQMQQFLIDNHKQNIERIASRLPDDIEVYSEMLPTEKALEKAFSNPNYENTLLWVRNGNKIITKFNSVNLASNSDLTELISLSSMPAKPKVVQVKQGYFIIWGENLIVKGKLLGTICAAQDITRDQTMFIAIVQNVIIASTLVIIVISGIIAFYIKHSLQPLRQISQMTAAIEAEDLGEAKLYLDKAPSEVKELAQTVDMMLSRLSQSWEKQRQFTSNVSHELRTPLTIVHGYLQSVLRRQQNLTEIQKEALETAASEAERTINILEHLLDLVRADSGYLQFHLQTCILNDLLSEIVDIVYKNNDITINIQAELDSITVKADSRRLKQVLLNLIDNAIQYSDPGSPINLKIKQDKDKGIIEVCDNGYGIPLQHQSRIFERFYRVDEARTRSTGGTGLGLSIVKTFVEGMGGTVEVLSQLGKGSIFTIKLPILL
jgi:hypothetical protein